MSTSCCLSLSSLRCRPLHQAPTLIGCWLLKNLAIRSAASRPGGLAGCCEALCSSAAEKAIMRRLKLAVNTFDDLVPNFFQFVWRGWLGSNQRPLASEANTLSTELQPRRSDAKDTEFQAPRLWRARCCGRNCVSIKLFSIYNRPVRAICRRGWTKCRTQQVFLFIRKS